MVSVFVLHRIYSCSCYNFYLILNKFKHKYNLYLAFPTHSSKLYVYSNMSFAVRPFLLQILSKRWDSLDESNNILMMSLWRFCAALWTAVFPSLSWWNTSAPFRSKSWTIFWWPNRNAEIGNDYNCTFS